MQRTIALSLVVTAFVAAAIVAGRIEFAPPAFAQMKAREVPRFEVDPSWPKLPAKWVFALSISFRSAQRRHGPISNLSFLSTAP